MYPGAGVMDSCEPQGWESKSGPSFVRPVSAYNHRAISPSQEDFIFGQMDSLCHSSWPEIQRCPLLPPEYCN